MFTFFGSLLWVLTCFCWYLLGVGVTKTKVELYVKNEKQRVNFIIDQIHWLLERAEPEVQEEFLDKFGRK